jgi:hypothetical protein
MSVRLDQNVIHLEGACPVGDAETLLAALRELPDADVDLGAVTRLHLALVQVLLAASRNVRGVPVDPFLRDHVLPLLRHVNNEGAMPKGPVSI